MSTPDSSPSMIELLNGDHVPLREAVGCYKYLQLCLDQRPLEFDAMLQLSRGTDLGESASTAIQHLQQLGIVDENRKLAPIYRSVIESSVIEDTQLKTVELLPPISARKERLFERWAAAESEYATRLLERISRPDESSREPPSR